MECPDCGTENLPGADECEDCGQDLRSLDIPAPEKGLQKQLLTDTMLMLPRKNFVSIGPDKPVTDAIALMQKKKTGSVLVMDKKKLVGILTERDILMKVVGQSKDLSEVKVDEMMTQDPVVLKEEDSLAFALNRMAVGGYRHNPVMRDDKPVNIVSARDILKYIFEPPET